MPSIAAKPSRASPASLTVELLNTETARLFTHVHPVLILSLFYIRFNALVADPISTLGTSLLFLSTIQLSYVITCLPVTSDTALPVKPDKAKPSQRKKPTKAKGDPSLSGRVVPALLSLALSLIVGAPILTVILILFGAPITTHLWHTLLCGAHMSVLAVLPLIYVHGVDSKKWREVVGLLLPIDQVFGATIGTLFGAWIGAVPIPLDWDREWQKWPVTIVTGAYLGHVIGKLVGKYLLKGKVIDFDEESRTLP